MAGYCRKVVGALTGREALDKEAPGRTDARRARADISGELSVVKFADGEMEAELGTSVRGCDAFLFAGSARNDVGLSVEEAKMETYHAVDALRRAQAARITLFEPFCGPGRSDRLTRRNSVGLWVHFKILASLGIDHYVTFQLHSEKSKSFIDPVCCAVDDLPAHALLKAALCGEFIRTKEALRDVVKREWMFCAVDAGGEALAKRFGSSFGTGIVISHKQRDYSSPNRVETINILASEPLEGKTLWIVDDMIDTGDSMCKLVRVLAERRPSAINIAVVHPVFSPPALEQLGRLSDEGLIANILVTDTLPCPAETPAHLPCLRVVPSFGMAAEIVHRLNGELPLSPLLAPFNAPDYLR
jgi:ribose-phosphate pyrophosphokinase